MLEWYHMVLLLTAAAAIVFAWEVPRAAAWVALGAALYALSAMWHNMGWPYATAFGAGTNFVMIAFLWAYADQKWELRLWNFYHLMLVVDLLYMAGFIRDHFVFAVTLEVINLVALLFIIVTGLVERVSDGHPARYYHPGRANFFHRALYAPAKPIGRR